MLSLAGTDRHRSDVGAYNDAYRRSLDDPEGFWAEVAQDIDWFTPPKQILDDRRPPFTRWFAGGELNTSYNALDRHVDGGRADQLALVYDSPVTDTVASFTYRELRDRRRGVRRRARRSLGVEKGDRVIVYMPMVPEAAVAMLACARLGAIHSVVFGGFASNELAIRIDDAKPKVIVTASCGIEGQRVIPYMPLLEGALEIATHAAGQASSSCSATWSARDLKPGRDLDWNDAIAGATPADSVPVDATHPLYVLYTSGTTAMPKGVVRDNGGHAVALRWSLPNVYDTHPGEVFWAASDVGWVVGHSYIVYAPLLTGCTTILYEGKPVGTPDPGAFWRVIARARREDALHRADGVPRDQEGRPERRRTSRSTTCRGSCTSSSPANGSTRTPTTGRSDLLGRPRHRPLVADRDRLADRGEPDGHRADAGEARLADEARARLRRPHPRRSRTRVPAGRRRCGDGPVAAAAGDAADAVERRRALRALVLLARIPAPTSPATADVSTPTATSTSWDASTTSSTSPGTGCPPARWRRSSRSIRTSPSAR